MAIAEVVTLPDPVGFTAFCELLYASLWAPFCAVYESRAPTDDVPPSWVPSSPFLSRRRPP